MFLRCVHYITLHVHHMYMCIHLRVCVSMCVRVCVHVCTCICVCVSMCVCVCVHVHVSTYIAMYMCMCVYTYVHVCSLCTCVKHIKSPQRIGTSLRVGGPKEIHLERFVEALQDTESGLTYPALVGTRKQSVEDVERLFGEPLIAFMEHKKYSSEAQYLRIIRNWRRAVDERGLTDDQRQQYNKDLLDFILDDLMPWHRKPGMRDFSLLEVNRYDVKL